jgi:integrase
MKAMDRNYMDGTKDSIWRRYKRQDRDIDYLYRNGVLTTTSVKKMKPVDVHNLLMYRRSLNVSDADMVHEMSALANIFKFVGNTAYEVALREYPQLKVSATHVRLPSLEPEECREIIDKAATIKDGDWFNMVRYAVVVFAFCSGLRSKELRLCDVNCIRMKEGTWTVEVRHPKGEGKYGGG